MTPETIIRQSAADGVLIKLSPDGALKATGKQEHVDKWLPVIRDHKPEIIKTLSEAMTADEENSILKWLMRIEETDPAIIEYVLNKCRADVDALGYFLNRARESALYQQPGIRQKGSK